MMTHLGGEKLVIIYQKKKLGISGGYKPTLIVITHSGINNSFKKGTSPNVGKSQMKFYPPPDISRPDISYQHVM